MELENKFEEIINSTIYFRREDEPGGKLKAAKECTKLCLEEQERLLARLGSKKLDLKAIFDELNDIQQQLKELE